MFKNRYLRIFYHWVLPAAILLALGLSPGFRSLVKNGSFFEWLGCLMFPAIYVNMARIEPAPTKSNISFWKRGFWGGAGTFRGDQFIPYFDKSAAKFFYFFQAVLSSLLFSLLIAFLLPAWGIAPQGISIVLAVANFFLLFVPCVFFYPRYMKAVYP